MQIKLAIDKVNGFDLLLKDTRLSPKDKLIFYDLILNSPKYLSKIHFNGNAKSNVDIEKAIKNLGAGIKRFIDPSIEDIVKISDVSIKKSILNLFRRGYLKFTVGIGDQENKSELLLLTNPRLLSAGIELEKNGQKKKVAADDVNAHRKSPLSLFPFSLSHTLSLFSFSLDPSSLREFSLFLAEKKRTDPQKNADLDSFSNLSFSGDIEEKIITHRRADPSVIKNIRSLEESTSGIEFIFRYWNSIGKPFAVHKRGTKKEVRINRLLKCALKKHKVDTIIEAIEAFLTFLISKEASVNMRKAGYASVGLDDFFQFDSHIREVIAKSNKKLIGLKGWFEEACKGTAYLIEKYGTRTPDRYPIVTKHLMMLWAEKIERGDSFTPQQMNHFRRAAVLTVKFLEENKSKLIMSHRELNYPAQFARYVIACFVDLAKYKPRANTSYLMQDWFYEEALKLYLTNQGYYADGRRNK